MRGAIYHRLFRIATTKYHFFIFPDSCPAQDRKNLFQSPCPLLHPRRARQEEACASSPLSTIGKISATQDKVCSIRGGMFFFSLSRTNMKAPAMARP